MSEMTQVWERLFVGSHLDAEGLSGSNPDSITTVVTLCEHKVLRRNNRVNYIHLAIADASPVSVGRFDAILDAISENIRWGKVLVNCGEGISRSPIMVASHMHAVGYKNINAALKEIAKLRPIINTSGILLGSVKEHLR